MAPTPPIERQGKEPERARGGQPCITLRRFCTKTDDRTFLCKNGFCRIIKKKNRPQKKLINEKKRERKSFEEKNKKNRGVGRGAAGRVFMVLQPKLQIAA